MKLVRKNKNLTHPTIIEKINRLSLINSEAIRQTFWYGRVRRRSSRSLNESEDPLDERLSIRSHLSFRNEWF